MEHEILDLEHIEKKQNIKFPEEYKRIYQFNFKEFNNSMEIHVKDEVFCIRRFLSADEMNDILAEFYDFWGYDIVPIAETDYEDYICLYYIDNRDHPSIVYWNYELALENSSEGITLLFDSIHEFIANIKMLSCVKIQRING